MDPHSTRIKNGCTSANVRRCHENCAEMSFSDISLTYIICTFTIAIYIIKRDRESINYVRTTREKPERGHDQNYNCKMLPRTTAL